MDIHVDPRKSSSVFASPNGIQSPQVPKTCKPDPPSSAAGALSVAAIHCNRPEDADTLEPRSSESSGLGPSTIPSHPGNVQQPQRTNSPTPDGQHNIAERVLLLAAKVEKSDNSSTPELDNVNPPKLDLGPSAVPSPPKDEQSPLPADQPRPDSSPGVGGQVSAPSIRLEVGDRVEASDPTEPKNIDRERELASEGIPNGATLKPNSSKVQDQLRSLPGSPTLRPVSDERLLARSAPSSPKLVPSIPRQSSDDALGFDPLHRRAFFAPTVSQAEQRWTRQKNMNKESNVFLDSLMKYEGLEAVKQNFLDIKSRVDLCQAQGVDLKTERFNIVFQGNPGTGKTTVARLYAKFLQSIKVIESDEFREFSGMGLVIKRASEISSILESMRDKGGVLFIDEAYQLASTVAGKQVLELLLTEMENNIGKLAMVFAGYKNEMEAFFDYNPGLPSRIPYVMDFADFTDRELWNILCSYIKERFQSRMEVEGGMGGLYMRIAVRRLSRGRGQRGFGNARAVQNFVDRVLRRQANRLTNDEGANRFLLTKEDVIGPDPTVAFENSKAWKEMQRLVGLKQVKERVRDVVRSTQLNYVRELCEDEPLQFTLNQLFVGDPGTGKTTVAKLYGRILVDLGYLSQGDVVSKVPADFIEGYLGQTEVRTRIILNNTVGKVLVIDNAELLDDTNSRGKTSSYNRSVVDTIVSMVQGMPGEDRCIILVGNKKKVNAMIQNVNPDLARRFPVHNQFFFGKFSISELEELMRNKMDEKDLDCTKEAMDAALSILKRALVRPNFSNATTVNQIIESAQSRWVTRVSNMPPHAKKFSPKLSATDFDPNFGHELRLSIDSRKDLDGRLNSRIIDQLAGYQNRCLGAWKRGLDPGECLPMNFVFRGLPGTGRTTAAKHIGKLFHDVGILRSPEIIECYGRDFVTDTVTETATRIQNRLALYLGRAVLIRDADYLCHFTTAVHEICHFLSQKDHQGKMVIILSGLKADMTWLMSTWPILLAVFDEQIDFENIPPQDCISVLVRELEVSKIITETSFLKDQNSSDFKKVSRLFNVMQQLPGWCNSRDIRQLARQMLGMLLEESAINIDPPGQPPPMLSLHLVIRCLVQRITQRRDQYVMQAANNQTIPFSLLPSPLVPGAQPAQGLANPLGQRLLQHGTQQARGPGISNSHGQPEPKIEVAQGGNVFTGRQQAAPAIRTPMAQGPVALGTSRNSLGIRSAGFSNQEANTWN